METLAESTVLIVDDDRDFATVLQVMLTRQGIPAQAVNSGTEALEWLKHNLPAAIVLDVMMPDIDGLTVLRQLRASQSTAELPVVMLSAKADSHTRAEGMAAGADDYLTKPATAKQLADALKAQLAKRAVRGSE